jgi:hypothetical protein
VRSAVGARLENNSSCFLQGFEVATWPQVLLVGPLV